MLMAEGISSTSGQRYLDPCVVEVPSPVLLYQLAHPPQPRLGSLN